jgi:hypothetical protein
MTRVVLDAELRSKLLDLVAPLLLTDENGNIIARVLPQPDASRLASYESPTDEVELRRRETSNEPRYSLAQVMEHLRKL